MFTVKRCAVLFFVLFLAGCGTPKSRALNQDSLIPLSSDCGNADVLAEQGGLCLPGQDGPSIEVMNRGGAPVSGEAKDSGYKKPDDSSQDLLNSALDFYRASQEYWNEGSPESAIEALDQAYALILEVNADDRAELIQQKEDLRFMVSRRILEIYASRHTAANGSHKAIPHTLNEHVEKEIKLFQGAEREFFLDSYRRSGRHRGMIMEALREAGLPEDISWLPLIESGFKVNALSRARALGLWQFIPSTGYKFGLSRDKWIDERLDPEKSTRAAIAYLKELHRIFGDWTTVLAAYNCGEGTVLRVIRNQKVNYLDNFWDLYERLPRETARYVPRFLAVLHILKDPGGYGFSLEEPDSPLPYEYVSVEKPVRLKDVAKKLGVESGDLIALNTELRFQATPDRPYALKVPPGEGQVLLASLDEIPKWSPPKKRYAYHRVRRGETLSTIAHRYRTSVSSIMRANRLRSRNMIRAGKVLKIPLRWTSRSYSSYKLSSNGDYRVRRGDSLWLIAKRFNTTTGRLKKLNNLTSAMLSVGQVLRIR